MTHQPSFQLKLDRASEHLESVKAQERLWAQGNPCRVWTEFDIQSGYYRIWAEALRPPPITLAPVIGDCLHNLRSALDNLAYELALAHKGERLSRSMANDSAFPMFRTKSAFDDQGKPMIRGIRPEAKTIIEGLQPYYRGYQQDFSTSTLWWLRELSNSDKHRLPHLAVATVERITLFFSDPSAADAVEFFWPTFEDRAVVARYPAALGTYTEVDMQRPPTFGVAFGEGSPDLVQGWSVRAVLTHIRDHIAQDVVTPLLPFLA
jgi:hypothetical protein